MMVASHLVLGGGLAMWIHNAGYRLIAIRVQGKRKLVLEHRYLIEQFLGRTLATKEHVHHINGDKLDNRLENLTVMPIGQHNTHHFRGKRFGNRHQAPWNKGTAQYTVITCNVCGSQITRLAKHVKAQMRRNRIPVCSFICRGKLGRQTQLA